MRTGIIFLLIAASASAQSSDVTSEMQSAFHDFMESNQAQISIDVRFVTASPTVLAHLKTQDLIRTEQPNIQDDLPDSSDEQLAQQGGIELVSATTIVEEREPVFIRALSDQQMSQFMQIAQSDPNSNIMFAPKITVFDQQKAVIQDTTQRPFVVGLTKVGTEYEPQIKSVDDGIKVALKAAVKNTDVRLDLAIKLSDIQDVSTRDAGPEGTMIQIPSVKATKVELSALLAKGETLAIYGLTFNRKSQQTRGVPYIENVPYVGRLFSKTEVAAVDQNLLILVTPRITAPGSAEE